MNWIKEGLNYWENPDCSTDYLCRALVNLISDIEGVILPISYFDDKDRKFLIKEIEFYEYLSDK